MSDINYTASQYRRLQKASVTIAGYVNQSISDDLPDDIVCPRLVPVLRRPLKTFLFGQSFSDDAFWVLFYSSSPTVA